MDKKTYTWINAGPYEDDLDVSILVCCYTHKNGRKMKNMILVESGDEESCMSKYEESDKKAMAGGAWSLEGTQDEILVKCREDMHKLLFSPFPAGIRDR